MYKTVSITLQCYRITVEDCQYAYTNMALCRKKNPAEN